MFRAARKKLNALLVAMARPIVLQILDGSPRVWGDKSRLRIDPTANVVNSFFNTTSGTISIGAFSFTGHNVSFLTGTHDTNVFLDDRINRIPSIGRDIAIGQGVWICSNAVILGPCTVGDHAVIAAGALVVPGTVIKDYQLFAGVPARLHRTLSPTGAAGRAAAPGREP